MSATSTVLTEDHIRYLAERTQGDDDFLRKLKADAKAAGIPAIWISPEQASFMQVLLKLSRAREVIEVGTLAGYSAITMARALPRMARSGDCNWRIASPPRTISVPATSDHRT